MQVCHLPLCTGTEGSENKVNTMYLKGVLMFYRHEPDGSTSYCIFEGSPPALKRCNPDPPSRILVYTGQTGTQCQVTVLNLTESDGGTYSARLGLETTAMSVEVIVAVPVKNGTVSLESQPGEEGEIRYSNISTS